MTQNVNAEIIAIGTEILLGEITDTNSVFIARLLRDIGVNLYYMTSVGDNEGRIAGVIQNALSRANVVITCGGLGPTVDDMTRQAVAAATERGLTFHQPLLDKIAERFVSFRAQMTDNNRRQAYLPDNAILIENPVGTAPSFIVEHEGGLVISLPGVPREMKFLMTERVVPFLRERFDLRGHVIKAKVLKTAGIGESALDELIGNDLLEASNPTVGLAAHTGQVDMRITAKADTRDVADAMIAQVEAELRRRVGPYIFGVDADTLESAFIAALRDRNAQVAISEAGLDGAISSRMAAAPDGNSVVAAVHTYADPDAAQAALGTTGQGTLRDLAERLAQTSASETGATLGLAAVSLPNIEEDHADAEEGSAVAIWSAGQVRSRAYGFGGMSDTARQWTSNWALAMAWRMLLERDHGG